MPKQKYAIDIKELTNENLKIIFLYMDKIKGKTQLLDSDTIPLKSIVYRSTNNDVRAYLINRGIIKIKIGGSECKRPIPNDQLRMVDDFELIVWNKKKFNDLFKKLKTKLLNKRSKQKSQSKTNQTTSKNGSEILYWITFDDSGEIWINDIVLLTKPRDNARNSRIFKYIYENPDKTITLDQLKTAKVFISKDIPEGKTIEQEEIKEIRQFKNFHDFLTEIKFTDALKKTFFPIIESKTIKFRNPVTKDTFKKLEHTKFLKAKLEP